MTLAWTSPTIPYLQHLLLLSPYQEACISASCFFGAAFGPVFGKELVERFGYRSVMFSHAVLYSVALVLLAFSPSVICLTVGRIVAGLACGMFLRYIPSYVMEIADSEVYKVLSPTVLPTQALGYLLAYTLGPPQLTYHQLLWLYVSVPVMSLASYVWLPESAKHDVSKGKLDRAEVTIAFLRRGISTSATQAEVLFLQEKVTREPRTKSGLHSLLSDPADVRALTVMLTLSCLQPLSGTPIVLTLTQHLLTKSESLSNPNTATIVIGVVVFFISIIVSLFMRDYSCKRLLACSSIAMAVSMVLAGVYFNDMENVEGPSFQLTSWTLTSSVLLHLATYQTGFANICHGTYSMFSTQKKEVAISTAMTTTFFFSSIAVFFYYLLDDHLGSAVTMWIFAFFCVVSALVSVTFIPDSLKFDFYAD
ncbi:solute carrier family 2, facilitated glucose transporter member 8-like isoform X2 [Homalodisca vitripennis]|nr:solute carrier family 2, facilitated glucose transporter member 8-like isoform X2 [Homalodisca vitripennis]